MIGLLVTLLVAVVIGWIVWTLVNLMAPPEPVRRIILVILLLIALLWVISMLGAFGPEHRYFLRFQP